MKLQSDIELANTKIKLDELQARYEHLQNQAEEDTRARTLTRMSIKRLIKQLTEEIAVYKAHHLTAH